MIRVLIELRLRDDTSVLNEKSAGLFGYSTFFWAFFLDFIESKPFSYRHFRLFQHTLVSAWVYSIYFLFGKEAQRKGLVTSLYAVIAYSASAITLFPLPYFFQTNYIGHPIIVYLYIFLMAIFAQIIGQNCLNLSLRWTSPIIVTLAVMFEPIFAGILAYIVFDEAPSYILLIGVTILLIGVGVTAVNLKT